jgi:hypothetical protein
VKVEDVIIPFLFNRIADEKAQTKEFSGIFIISKLNGDFVNGYKVENGIFVSQFVENNATSKTSKTMYAPCGWECLSEAWQNLNEVVITPNRFKSFDFGPRGLSNTGIGNVPSPRGTSGGGGSGGGNTSGAQAVNVFPCDDPRHGCRDFGAGDSTTANIVFVGPSNKISNINEYLKCFNLGQSAELVIYVDQPTANSPTPYTYGPDPNDSKGLPVSNVGHTFIAIQQGNIRRVVGYYPKDPVNPATSSTATSVLSNNENHFFDVSISTRISSSQLVNIVGYCSSTPIIYDLNNYNCTDFGIEIAKLGGLNLPDSYGKWPYGGGSNPGQLGQNIREMYLPAGVNRQVTGTNSASNK